MMKAKRYQEPVVALPEFGGRTVRKIADFWVCLDCGAAIPADDKFAIIHDNFHESIEEVRNWAFNQGAFSD